MNGNSRERTKYWRAEGFDDLELLAAAYVTHSFDRHIHEGFALAVGFSDQSHLTRRFKRVVGIPPGHYLQQLS